MFHSVRPTRSHLGTRGKVYGVPPYQSKTGRGRDDPHFNLVINFGDEECGRLVYEDNELKFEGSFQTSGRIFAEFVWHKFKEHYSG